MHANTYSSYSIWCPISCVNAHKSQQVGKFKCQEVLDWLGLESNYSTTNLQYCLCHKTESKPFTITTHINNKGGKVVSTIHGFWDCYLKEEKEWSCWQEQNPSNLEDSIWYWMYCMTLHLRMLWHISKVWILLTLRMGTKSCHIFPSHPLSIWIYVHPIYMIIKFDLTDTHHLCNVCIEFDNNNNSEIL